MRIGWLVRTVENRAPLREYTWYEDQVLGVACMAVIVLEFIPVNCALSKIMSLK